MTASKFSIALALALLVTVPGLMAMELTVTAYSQNGEMANGENTRTGVVAVSRDLLKDIPMGSIISIDEVGDLEVCDVMHKRKCKSLDVYVKTEREAKHFGRKRLKARIKRYGKKEEKTANAVCPTWNRLFQKRR